MIMSVQFMSLGQWIARCLPGVRCLCSENVAIGIKTSIEDYFVGKKTVLGCRSCSRLVNYATTFEQSIFSKLLQFEMVTILR